jgi:hypothetical protein
MANPLTPQLNPLFPTRDSLREVKEIGIAMLPITSANQLVALLNSHQNTILSLQGEQS